jgi:hypothetical protein
LRTGIKEQERADAKTADAAADTPSLRLRVTTR